MRRAWHAIVGVVACAAVALAQDDHSARFEHAAVAADHELASRAGVRVLEAGGNAVDAAVATSFALSVVRPYSCGIGGGGFMVIHLSDRVYRGGMDLVIDYREVCPGAIGPEYYERIDNELASRYGGTAVAVPGTVRGLMAAQGAFGYLTREQVLAPAIELARDGFEADAHYAEAASGLIEKFGQHPEWKDRFAFVWTRFLREGEVKVGDRITLPEQARALELIAGRGASVFYEGPIARAIVDSVRSAGGGLSPEDLRTYQPRTTQPMRTRYRQYELLTMPPPSSGGIVESQVFGVLDRLPINLRELGRSSPAYIHVLTECLKHAFADRAEWLGDDRFVDVPISRLTSGAYLDAIAQRLDTDRTHGPGDYGTRASPPDDGGTSHLCVIDAWGSAVACTETINLEFGSLVAVDEYGFVLNNEMDDFTTRRGEPNAFGLRQSDANLPEPGKKPLSSMSPTIVLDADGGVVAIAGASGGPRIITGTIQALLNVLVFDMDAGEAVGSPRFHHQWLPDVLQLEPALEDESLIDALRARGHEVGRRDAVGNVQLIRRARDGDGYEAACDSRKGGRPAGY